MEPEAVMKLSSIYVKPGQTFTVYLSKDPGARNLVQVELRVRRDGTPEVFMDHPARSFKDWTSMDGAPDA